MYLNSRGINKIWLPLAVTAALLFLYSAVLSKLVFDWWNDDNYSHGLIVPFVIAYIVWHASGQLSRLPSRPRGFIGGSMIAIAALMLLGGTLASVLVAQRLSLVIMAAGVIVYFSGFSVLRRLTVPFVLFLLSIPIPQIIFNKIAFPLQILASKAAGYGIDILNIPVTRKGNLIEIPFRGTAELISLEVVEACSGIRSLMTLITLALILGYFTRRRDDLRRNDSIGWSADADKLRTLLLMAASVPVALLTNAARVMATGVLAYYQGRESIEGLWHDLSASLVFVSALLMLLGINAILTRLLPADFGRSSSLFKDEGYVAEVPQRSTLKAATLLASLLLCGVFVNWFQYRGETAVERRQLKEMPGRLGTWEQRNDDIRFDPDTESVLKASDYVMRDYYGPGKRINLYIGYYASQRTGATYHSPLSCLPGTGWELTDPELMDISTPGGNSFSVNRYIVKQGEHSEYLLYWYQGRGRTFASEYEDKLYTSLDSVTRRRSDGGMVRIMTPIGKDPQRSLSAAVELAAHVAENINEFVPD